MATISDEGRALRERARRWFVAYCDAYKAVFGANDSRIAELFDIGNSTLTGYKTTGGSFGADALFFLRKRWGANLNRIVDRDLTEEYRAEIFADMEARYAERNDAASGQPPARGRRKTAHGG